VQQTRDKWRFNLRLKLIGDELSGDLRSAGETGPNTTKTQLQLYITTTLFHPQTQFADGRRCLAVPGPSTWKSLPVILRNDQLSSASLCHHVNTQLYYRAYTCRTVTFYLSLFLDCFSAVRAGGLIEHTRTVTFYLSLFLDCFSAGL